MLLFDHLACHQIQGQEIYPQQAQSQLQLLNAMAWIHDNYNIITKVRSEALQVNDTLW